MNFNLAFLATISLLMISSHSYQIANADKKAVIEHRYKPRNSQASGQHPMSPEEALKAWQMPEGFKVSLFAAEPDVHQPVAMTTDFKGRIWVAESYSYKEWKKTREDRVVILEDTDNDGKHDKRKVFWTGGNHVSGMTVGWGGIWICDAPNLLFIPDKNGDDIPDGPPEVVLDGWSTKASHNFINGLKFGVDGWLYGRHGILRQSSVGKPGTPDNERVKFDCAIWRLHPVTHHFEVVCRGTTNPWGHDWDETGELFFTNNVNGHLWHSVPGALFPRMGNRPDANVKYDYERMPMTADHLHHAGTDKDWTKSRDGKGVHGDLGGGHSHCGAMIYLGDNWPKTYRGRILMCNTHGRRLNQNILQRQGSGYVGRRAPDLFFANNAWFRGVTVMYGPDGGVYVSDWSDFGECHDNDGVHRTSGRIFKFTYGEMKAFKPPFQNELDLTKLGSKQLVALHTHANEWYVRKARHLLQWGAYNKQSQHEAIAGLKKLFASSEHQVHRLRALMTLLSINAFDDEQLWQLLQHEDEHVRKWGVRALSEPKQAGLISNANVMQLVGLVNREQSSIVLLYLASAMGRMEAEGRMAMLTALAQKKTHLDKNTQLMIWYGIKDILPEVADKSMTWFAALKRPLLKQYAARLLAEEKPSSDLLGGLLLDAMDSPDDLMVIAEGIAAGLKGKVLAPMARWSDIEKIVKPKHSLLADQLALSFDRDRTIVRLKKNPSPEALSLLVKAKTPGLGEMLLTRLNDDKLRSAAIKGLMRVRHPEAYPRLIELYPDLSTQEKADAINVMVANKGAVNRLLNAIEAGDISASAITAFQARQIAGMRDKELRHRLRKVWGELKTSDAQKRNQIKAMQNQLTHDVLAKADLEAGKRLFAQRCQTCHTFFGEGGKIGPDLTGADRKSVYYLLENIIDPNAILPRDFQVHMVTRQDDSIVSGMLAGENKQQIRLTTPTGEVAINMNDIKHREKLNRSLMPEGLLVGLKPDQVRDLIAYLMK